MATTYDQIIKAQRDALDDLGNRLGLIWAFDKKQFEEGISELQQRGIITDGDKMQSIGCGGYIPVKNAESYNLGFDAILDATREQITASGAIEEAIRYELWNNEGNIEDTLRATAYLGATEEMVYQAYTKQGRC